MSRYQIEKIIIDYMKTCFPDRDIKSFIKMERGKVDKLDFYIVASDEDYICDVLMYGKDLDNLKEDIENILARNRIPVKRLRVMKITAERYKSRF